VTALLLVIPIPIIHLQIATRLSPRVTIKYDVKEFLQARISYSQGYRALQIFDEDLHIETSGSRRVIHVNSPDLKQETSSRIMLSLDFNKKIGNIYQVHKHIIHFLKCFDKSLQRFPSDFRFKNNFFSFIILTHVFIFGASCEVWLHISSKLKSQIYVDNSA
jgi:hypothetical protein